MNNITFEKMVYLGITIAFYLLQIYQNVMSCIRFYNNIKQMNEYLVEIKEYLKYSIHSMNTFTQLHKNKPTYTSFCNETDKHLLSLNEFLLELESIQPFKLNLYKLKIGRAHV